MVNRNIQMKKRNNDTWENLFPLTLNENVYNVAGVSLDNQLTNLEDGLTNDFSSFQDTIDNDINDLVDYIDGKSPNTVSVSDYDVDPTGNSDSLAGFKQAINDLENNQILVLEKNANYLFSDMLSIEKGERFVIEGNGATIYTNVQQTDPDEDGRGLELKGKFLDEKLTTATINANTPTVRINNTDGLEKGQLLYFQSEEQFSTTRNYYKKGGAFTITEIIDDNTINISGSFPYDIQPNCIVTVYNPITVEINNLSIVANNPLPAGRFGISLFYSDNSVLNNVYADNFNHCFHLNVHHNTMVQRVKSGRSYYDGTSESYGLASYIGSYLTITNSVFHSGRHGLEISGRENSFKSRISNVSAFSETGGVAFNQHQASFDSHITNSIFGSIGISNSATIENCFIGGQGSSRIKTSENHTETRFKFSSCRFNKNHIIRVSDDAQNQDNTANMIGLVKIEDCITIGKLQLSLNIGDKYYRFYKLLIDNTDNVETVIGSNTRVDEYIYKNSSFTTDTNVLVQNQGRIMNRITFDNMILTTRYNLISTTRFNEFYFLNCKIYLRDGESKRTSITSKDGDTHVGRMLVLNTNLTNLKFDTGGWDYLTLVNSEVDFYSGASSVQNKSRTVMESF